MSAEKRLHEYCVMLEQELDRRFPEDGDCAYRTIFDAMRYSIMAGGKRIRPVLVLEFCRVCGGDIQKAMPFAVAIEMIHTYSLIHDDLPCMDNDDMRRGKPTNHKVYGEGMAVLAGDALLTGATLAMAEGGTQIPPSNALMAIRELSYHAGAAGMIGGQVIDLESEDKQISLDQLKELQSLKTGALLEAACKLGCIVAGKTDHDTLLAAQTYGLRLGRAFQIQDDILDIEGDSETLGKTIGKDEKSRKSTFPSLLGLARCHELVQEETDFAIYAAKNFADCEFLMELAESLVSRKT